jgi:hypothetical protein
MSSVTVELCGFDYDLLDANSRGVWCGACPLGRRRRGQGGALQGERSLHRTLGSSSAFAKYRIDSDSRIPPLRYWQ